ncbi:MAG: HNH endonuclease [Anaerolineaceae bacterium]|nr:HNH endonuclease [Anaerolineaceae bacterium]
MTYIPAALRREVVARAGNCCEYCLLSQEDIFFAFEVDHIVSEKHAGQTTRNNLCLSCPDCNRFKGSDIGSIDRETDIMTALFNPRIQAWDEHFRLANFVIESLTSTGRVTVQVLRLNLPERIQDREFYAETGHYPCRP